MRSTQLSAIAILEAKVKLRDEWKAVVARCESDRSAFWFTNLGNILGSQDAWVFSWRLRKLDVAWLVEFNDVKHEILQEMLVYLNGGTEKKKRDKLKEKNRYGVPLLHQAVEWESVSCVALLLREGADIKQRTVLKATVWDVLSESRRLLRSVTRSMKESQRLEQILDLLSQALYAKEQPPNSRLTGATAATKSAVSHAYGTTAPQERFMNLAIGDRRFKYLWVHLPCTNGLLMLTVLKNIEIERRISPNLSKELIRIFYDTYKAPSIAPAARYLNYREPFYSTTQINGLDSDLDVMTGSSSVSKQTTIGTAIVFPCLALDSIHSYRATRRQYKDTMDVFLSTGGELANWKIHCERTLDEAYYPALSEQDLTERNNDQVVSRWYRRTYEQSTSGDEKRIPILMVSQLWLLGAGRIILSASSMSTGSNFYRGLDPTKGRSPQEATNLLFYKVRTVDPVWTQADYDEDRSSPPRCLSDAQTVDCQMGTVLARVIESFGKASRIPDIDSQLPPILSIYETSVLALLSEVDNYLDPGKPATLEIDVEMRFTHEIWDLRSELVMIGDVLGQQERVLDDLLSANKEFKPARQSVPSGEKTYPSSKQDVEAQWARIFAARPLLSRYRQRIKKIEADAERIDRAIQDMLNLKRTFANMKEAVNSSKAAQNSFGVAENSLRLARSSVVLSAAVVGFTVVTVIFTPLSFLTGLFALPTDELRRLMSTTDDTQDVYISRYVGGIFVGTELATLAFTAAVVALSVWALRRWEEGQQDPTAKALEGNNESGTEVLGDEKVEVGTLRRRPRQPDEESQTPIPGR